MVHSLRPRRNAPLTGIAFKVGSVLIFLVMSSLLKASHGVPAGELVFFRSFFGVLPVVVFLRWRGELREGLRSHNVGSQIWRGLVGTMSMGLGFFALTKLPLPEAVTINYAMPLVIVILSALVLHETVRLYRWTAVVIGLCGVVVIASGWFRCKCVHRGRWIRPAVASPPPGCASSRSRITAGASAARAAAPEAARAGARAARSACPRGRT